MTRSELHALVWSVPAVHAAKRLGISSARLRKVCEEYAVPMPLAGYWTKRAYGKDDGVPPLPPSAPTMLGKLGAALRRFGEVPLEIADAQIRAFDLGAASPPLADASPAVRRLTDCLAAARIDAQGFMTVRARGLPFVMVGSASAARAVNVFEGFLEALACHRFVWDDAVDGSCIRADGEEFALKLFETRQRASNDAEAFSPSGKLCLAIVDTRSLRWNPRNLVGEWHDRVDHPLEESFADAMTAIASATSVVKLCRARTESEAARAHAQAAEAAAHKARESLRLELNAFLLMKADAYSEYKKLLEFAEYLSSHTDADAGPGLQELHAALAALIAERRKTLSVRGLLEEAGRRSLLPGDRPR